MTAKINKNIKSVKFEEKMYILWLIKFYFILY